MTWLYVWLGVTALALIIEFITADMVTVWFAGGGIIAMILAGCGVAWYIHLPVFIVVSLTLMLCFRRLALKFLIKDDVKTNAESAIGKEFTLITAIGFNQFGTIKVGDVVWNVDTQDEHESIEAGEVVKILQLKGNKYIVEKADKSE